MNDLKIVKICGMLCIVLAVLAMLNSVIGTSFGYRFLRFDPTDESSLIGLQHFLNFLIQVLFLIISTLPMYLALAGFYFYGAIGKDRWARILFGVLVALAITEITFLVFGSILLLLNSLEIINLFEGKLRNFYDFWYIQKTLRFYILTPFISIIFGIKALATRKVNFSMRLVPIFAGLVYLVPTYFVHYGNRPDAVPNLLAILIFFGLIALYFTGALGEGIWAKILLGILLFIASVTIIVEFISIIFDLLIQIVAVGNGLAGYVPGFVRITGDVMAYLLIPLSIFIGVTVLIKKKSNVFVGLVPIFAGTYFLLNTLITTFAGFDLPWSSISKSFQFIGVLNIKQINWCLIAVAILGISKWVRPFLLTVIPLNYLHVVVLFFILPSNIENLISVFVYSYVFLLIVQNIFMYYIWSVINDGKTKIKPWLAIAVGLIPMVNSLWFLFLIYKYPTAFNEFIDRNESGTDYISSTPFTVYLVLAVLLIIGTWIPYLNIIVGLLHLVAYIYLIAYTCKQIQGLESSPSGNAF